MARGVQRCMYCEDSLGTDIDHFEPVAVAPLRTFDWPNHLLACSHCNSNQKRDEYPCDTRGNCLLVDPTGEDPGEHLTLMLASGQYIARTPKGEATIRVFDLNREGLVRGRQAAFRVAVAVLRDWRSRRRRGEGDVADELAEALRISPFGGVVQAMERLAPGTAVVLLGAETTGALDEWCKVYASAEDGR